MSCMHFLLSLSLPLWTSLSFVRVFGPETKQSLELSDLLQAVGSLKFRGTSSLFRLKQSPIARDPVPEATSTTSTSSPVTPPVRYLELKNTY